MQITIREINKDTIQHVNQYDSSFTVDSKLVLSAKNGRISYAVVEIPSYGKQYQPEEVDYSEYVSSPDKTIFLAYVDDEPAGQIKITKYWNGYAYIDNFAVDTKYRRQGVGRLLIQRAIEWAKAKGFPGLMLETQDTNVAACRLYESCGFELGGFDLYLYRGLNRAIDEIALYWYLMFE
jgi:streptothricin acetyltransferase